MEKKEKKRVYLNDFIKKCSENSGITQRKLREIADIFEKTAQDFLNEATPEAAVEVRMMPHVIIGKGYVDPHEKRIPDGSVINVDGKYKTSVRLYGWER